MHNDLTADYFDCPHCGIKNVIYKIRSEHTENYMVELENASIPSITYEYTHYIIECTREECGHLSYFKIKTQFIVPGQGWRDVDEREIEIQYPASNTTLPDYIPTKIKKHYKEAINAFNFGLLSSASVMCRKVIYELCDHQNSEGGDYKEKISSLGFDKRITDPLLNIKNIGDETVHAEGWDKITIQKAIDALGIIIDMIFTQEERIKNFTNHYSQTKQQRKTKNS